LMTGFFARSERCFQAPGFSLPDASKTPARLHLQKQERRGPGDQDEPEQGFHADQDPHRTDRHQVPVADRGIGREGEIDVVPDFVIHLADDVAHALHMGQDDVGDCKEDDLENMRQQGSDQPQGNLESIPSRRHTTLAVEVRKDLVMDQNTGQGQANRRKDDGQHVSQAFSCPVNP